MWHAVTAKSRIPHLASLEEEAAFWDSHDSTEFEDAFEPVEREIARPLRHGFSVYFEGEVFDRILAAAQRRDIGFTQLAERSVIDGFGTGRSRVTLREQRTVRSTRVFVPR
jgi:hypothetical protein